MHGAFVRIRLDRSSEELVDAIAGIVEAVDGADPALLEDTVAEAGERLKRALREPDSLTLEMGETGW